MSKVRKLFRHSIRLRAMSTIALSWVLGYSVIASAASLPKTTSTASHIATRLDSSLAQTVAPEVQEIEVDVPDSVLRRALKQALRKFPGEPITRADMASFEGLRYSGHGRPKIADLTGLEFAVNLEELVLPGNSISDISPLSQLTDLWRKPRREGSRSVDLSDNLIEDLSPLSGVPIALKELNLSKNSLVELGETLQGVITHLDLSENSITDLAFLANLNVGDIDLSGNLISDLPIDFSDLFPAPSLQGSYPHQRLDLSDNRIRDLSPLAGVHLEALVLARNAIADLSPLSEMGRLRGHLDLSGNAISDIAPLAELVEITHLDLSGNAISDIAPLAELVDIRSLDLSGNAISDIAPLAELVDMGSLDLSGNAISDISALSSMTKLSHLALADNSVSTVQPLADMEQLMSLDLSGNSISDVGPLSSRGGNGYKYRLALLDLSRNGIADVESFRDFSRIVEVLDLSQNNIEDFSPLADVYIREQLDLSGNSISDLAPLRNFRRGWWDRYTDLSENLISDLSPLAVSDRISRLNLANNAIADISPLAAGAGFGILYLWGNAIEDISPLIEIGSLGELHLICCPDDVTDEPLPISNPLSEYSVTSHIPELRRRGVFVYHRPDDAAEVHFPDPALRDLIRSGISAETKAGRSSWRRSWNTRAGVATLTGLVSADKHITNLAGLEFAVSLRELVLPGNRIADISQLSHMTDLERLDLSGNRIGSIASLAGLSGLVELNLSANSITNLSPLTLHRGLQKLALTSNDIREVAALAGLNALTDLRLANNLIRDIASLSGLGELLHLDLSGNQVADIRPLRSLTKLKSLALDNNSITDVTPLRELVELDALSLAANQISDVTPLAGPVSPDYLDLSENLISDIGPLASHFDRAISVDLSFNRISNVEFLLDLEHQKVLGDTEVHLQGNPFEEQERHWLLALADHANITLDEHFLPVDIPDPALRACVARNLRRGRGELPPVTLWLVHHALTIGGLVCEAEDDRPKISDLTGLQHFRRLGHLSLPNHSISDIGPISELVKPHFKVREVDWVKASHYRYQDDFKRQKYQDLSKRLVPIYTIDLSGNEISDVSAFAGGVFHRLDLSDNLISDVSFLAQSYIDRGRRSTEIDLSGNRISEVGPLADATIVDGTEIIEGVKEIVPFDPTRLGGGDNSFLIKSLDLSDNEISDVSPLARLSYNHLDLSGNRISDVSSIPSSMRTYSFSNFGFTTRIYPALDLSDNEISGISPFSAAFSAGVAFGELHLAGNSIQDLTPLAGAKFGGRFNRKQTTLNLARNAISDVSALADAVQKVDHLDLSGNDLSEVPWLSGKSFCALDLSNNRITDLNFLSGLQLSSPTSDCAYPGYYNYTSPGGRGLLDLSYNAISDISPLAGLAGAPTTLILDHNSISDISPLRQIPDADTELRYLYLSNNEITDLQSISSLKVLFSLGLSNNLITEVGPLGTLLATSFVSNVDLSHNRIVDITPFKRFRGLGFIYLWGNRIEDIDTLYYGGFHSKRQFVHLTCCPPRPDDRNFRGGSYNFVTWSNYLQNSGLSDGDWGVPNPLVSNPLNEASLAKLELSNGYVWYSPDLLRQRNIMPDSRLREAVRLAVGDSFDLTKLRRLVAEDMGIVDLTGLDHAVNLRLLDVSGNAISSLAPIAGMPFLRFLDVSGNAISDLGPLETLPALSELDISSNSVSDISALAGLGRRRATVDGREGVVCGLSALDLSDNNVSDLSPLAHLGPTDRARFGWGRRAGEKLAGVSFLNLSSNKISNIEPLRSLANLWSLDLSNNSLSSNKISNIEPLRSLANLGSLDLSNNSISNVQALSAPSDQDQTVYRAGSGRVGYTTFDCRDSGLGFTFGSGLRRSWGGLEVASYIEPPRYRRTHFAWPSPLLTLDLSGNMIEDISPLSGRRGLQVLDVSDNSISDVQSLSALRAGVELRFLDVSSNAISDLAPLSGLSRLTALDASSNLVSDIGWLESLFRLRYLDLSSNVITDISPLSGLGPQENTLIPGGNPYGPSQVLPYRHLRFLDLSDNRIVDIHPLAGLGPGVSANGDTYGGLIHLDLSRNAVSDISPLGRLSNLVRLYLSENAISDFSPVVGRGAVLRHLEELDLSNNRVTNLQPLEDLVRLLATFIANRSWRLPSKLSEPTEELKIDLSGNPLALSAITGAVTNNSAGTVGILETVGARFAASWSWELPLVSSVESVSDTAIAAETQYTVPLFPSASNALRHGFVRVINRSGHGGEVRVRPIDDSGRQFGQLMLAIGPDESVHFNSLDLEMGNSGKGLIGSAGSGVGDWRLDFTSALDIQVLSYIRTRDGFLSSMHDTLAADGGGYHAPTFNPGGDRDQVSLLRLVNVGDGDVDIRITGADDTGGSPDGEVRLSVPEQGARTISAAELESGGSGLEGSLGNGVGKWRLHVESPASPGRLAAMSLLESPVGHLTNLSTIPSAQDDGSHPVLFFPSAANADGLEGFVRVINRSEEPGEVVIAAFDETGREYPPVTLALDAGQAAHFSSDDLEQGRREGGLSGAVGAGEGAWRLSLSSELDIDVLSYIRTPDGFLTSMHDVVPADNGIYEVVTFNPASNMGQTSILRLLNLGQEAAGITIRGVDSAGQSSDASVSLSIPGGAVRSYTAAELESQDGGNGLQGQLGDGAGKWRLLVASDQPLAVMSLVKSRTGHLTNVSTVPVPIHREPAAQASGTTPHLPPDAQLPEMVDIPAGEFIIGQGGRTSFASHAKLVTFSEPFAMSRHEVTFAQWDACVEGGGCYGYRPEDGGWGRGSLPVINVSWYDAQSYVAWLSAVTGDDYRLPSEAEWEYAAVAGSPTFARSPPSSYCDPSGESDNEHTTTPVGSFRANQWGLHDMEGNVPEWTLDCESPGQGGYKHTPVDGSAFTTACSRRVLRGGGYGRKSCSFRIGQEAGRRFFGGKYSSGRIPNAGSQGFGFRVVREY